MKDEQPYNDEQWSDLPLPDADKAWQKMEQLLDKDERRRPLLPWWLLRTTVGVLLLAFVVGGWLWLNSGREKEKETNGNLAKNDAQQTNDSRKQATSVSTNKTIEYKQDNPVQQTTGTPNDNVIANRKTSSLDKSGLLQKDSNQQNTTAVDGVKKKEAFDQQKKITAKESIGSLPLKNPIKARLLNQKAILQMAQQSQDDKSKPTAFEKQKTANTKQNRLNKRMVTTHNETNDESRTTITVEQVETVKNKDLVEDLHTKDQKKDTVKTFVVVKKDSVGKTDSTKIIASPPIVQAEKKKASKKRSAFVFSAGVGMQQSIALHNRPSPTSDSLGRKRPFFDYYPSVYVKLQRGKWAVQIDAQYSVPQPVTNVSFSQKTTYDPAITTLTTERYTVQKLYYHQLSLSLNYKMRPQWSVGIGGVYNLLAGAVTEEESASKNFVTGAAYSSKNSVAIKGYNDSFFYKTTAGLVVQTDYQWKRFSLGLRYTQNLQPFIKFTNPDGTVNNEKSNALQALLRFRLFRTKTELD